MSFDPLPDLLFIFLARPFSAISLMVPLRANDGRWFFFAV